MVIHEKSRTFACYYDVSYPFAMKVFLISYDLRKVGQNYAPLYDAIKSLSSDWQHPMESVWFVKVSDDVFAQAIFDTLKPALDDNDSLLILNVNNINDKQGWMPKTFWSWLG